MWADLSEMPIPCFATFKYDGELTYLLRNEEGCFTVNKWGRWRTEYPITSFVKDMVKVGETFVGELYVMDGDLYEFLRSRKDGERLRLAIFDVVSDEPYYMRWEVIARTFPKEGLIHLAQGELIKSREDLQRFFEEAVKRFEGIVCRHPQSRYEESPFKVKKLRTADVVVLAISKKPSSRGGKNLYEKGLVGSLLVGCFKNGEFIPVGRIGSGFSIHERKSLFDALTGFKVGEDEDYLYIEPKLVLEISYQEILESNQYRSGFALRHPVFRKFKFDAEAKECLLENEFSNS